MSLSVIPRPAVSSSTVTWAPPEPYVTLDLRKPDFWWAALPPANYVTLHKSLPLVGPPFYSNNKEVKLDELRSLPALK